MADEDPDILPGQLYDLKSDPEALKALYGETQTFRISAQTFEWKVIDYDRALNNDREKNKYIPRTNGLVLGVRCLELDFNIELPIHTNHRDVRNDLYPEKGTPFSIRDIWLIDSVIVFGEHFPFYPDSRKPCHISPRRSYFYGDANTLTPSHVSSIVQRLLLPRKRDRNYAVKRHWITWVDWRPQCFIDCIDVISKKIANNPIHQEYPELRGLGIWCPQRIKQAIQESIDLNQYDTRWDGPLHRCIAKGDEELFELVIKNGGDINMPTQYCRFTPLHRAVEPESKKYFLQRLLELGADLEAIETFRDRTPLGHAVKLGNLETVKKLVNTGTSLAVNRISKQSPLDIAFKKDHMEIIEFLSNFRAARNRSWSRRLLFSAKQLKVDQVEWLLKNGANPTTKNEKGQTPSDLIWEELNHPWMVSKRGRFDQKKSSLCFRILGLLEGKKTPKRGKPT